MPTNTSGPSRINFVRAFLASALGTGLARLLGAARDVVIAGFLGAGSASDAFWIAFLIPNMFRRFVADEGLTGAMLPALARAEADEGPSAVRRLASNTFGFLLVANVVFCIAGMLAAEPLVLAFAWSWRDDPEQLQLAVTMTRWMFPFVGMVSLVSFFEGLLNHRGHFFVPKVAPGLVSGGIVATVLLFGTQFTEPTFALVVGVLAGGIAHVLVNLGPMIRLWGVLAPKLRLTPRLRGILWEMLKVTAIGVFAQINVIVLRQIATSLPEGSVTYYHNGTRIVDLAQGIIAVGIGSALLPNLSLSVAEAAWDRFRRELTGALRLAALLLIPIALGTYLWSVPLTAILFRHGQYTWDDIVVTSQAVQFMVPFLLAVAAVNILKRVFFALDDRTTLLVVGAVGVATTGVLGVLLVAPYGIAGLALALSLATLVQLSAYLVVLWWRLGDRLGLATMVRPILTMAIASLPLWPLLSWLEGFGDWTVGPAAIENWGVLVAGAVLGAPLYLVIGRVLGLTEVSRLVGAVTRRFGR